jgi:cytochrome c oxidase subunit 2
MNWTLPPGLSTYASQIDALYYMILVITGIAFVVTEVALVVFLIKYRARPGRRAVYTHGSTKAEIIWTAVPTVTVIIIGLLSAGVWMDIKGRNSVPEGAYPIGVHGQQFEWIITYPGGDGALGTADDFQVRNQLHIPVNTPIVVELTAEEVIHSFFIPQFRVKQDAMPGMPQRVWFEAIQPGSYELACAELCGLGHYRMRAAVTVHTAEEYQQWMSEQAQPVALK